MQLFLSHDSRAILVADKSLRAVKCKKCGAKIYPQSLLKPHLVRHEQRRRSFMTELRKLRHTMIHMRDIA